MQWFKQFFLQFNDMARFSNGHCTSRRGISLRGYPIEGPWGRLYVHRLSSTSRLGATDLNCTPKRGFFYIRQ